MSLAGSPRVLLSVGAATTALVVAFSFRVIDSSSVRVEERLIDNGVVVVQVFGEPLLGYGLLIQLDISLCEEVVVGLRTCAKDDEEKESEVDGEVEDSVTQRVYET